MQECPEIRTLLVLYADGDLSAAEQEPVRAHLEACSGCRGALERLGPRPAAPSAPAPADSRELAALRVSVLSAASATPPPATWLDRLTARLFRGTFDVPKPLAWGGLALALALATLDRPAPLPPAREPEPALTARVIDEGIDVLSLATLSVN